MLPTQTQLVNGFINAATKQENQDNGQETYKISKDSINNLMNNIDVPKRPPSLFILYKRKNKDKLLEMFTDVKRSADLSKRMVEHFNNLDPDERKIYEDEYAELKAEYDQKMKLHLQYFPKTLPLTEKKKRGRPRKTSSTSSTSSTETEKNNKPTRALKSSFSKPAFIESDSGSDSENNNSSPQQARFVEIMDKETDTEYLVNLATCLYYDIDAPWGSALGRYSEADKVFTPY